MADEIYEEPEDPIVAPAVLAARAIEPAGGRIPRNYSPP